MTEICKHCGGKGSFGSPITFDKVLERRRGKRQTFSEFNRDWIQVSKSGDFLFSKRCPKCLGDGRLDWVERVVGKRMENVKVV